jgi:D-glycero-D-manno-heptose 1,7-bisphosphate phosphatase
MKEPGTESLQNAYKPELFMPQYTFRPFPGRYYSLNLPPFIGAKLESKFISNVNLRLDQGIPSFHIGNMKSRRTQKALFLDRDGVINKDVEFLHRVEDLEYMSGIFKLCEEFQKRGYLIFVITNQSGIARGYFTEEDFQVLTKKIHADFQSRGIKITKTYHCPHLPEITGECECRKPKPGMILNAQREFGLDLGESILVGDSERDVIAALDAGIPWKFLFKGRPEGMEGVRVIQSLGEVIGTVNHLPHREGS